jgi:hypothetical protein
LFEAVAVIVVDPAPTLQSGRATTTAGGGHEQLTLDTGTADVDMAVDYRVGSNGLGALAFRFKDANNYFLLVALGNNLQFYRVQGGTTTQIASHALATVVTGSTHRLEVKALGSSLQGWWDNSLVVSATDTFQIAQTIHGLDWNTAFDPSSAYDNLTIKDISVATQVAVTDSFTAVNGTLLSAHAPDVNVPGNPWVITSYTSPTPPAPTVQNGRATVAAGANRHLQATIDAGASDVRVAADYVIGTANGLGALTVRLTDTDNHLLLLVIGGVIQLHQKQAGVYTQLASVPLPSVAVGSTHRLEARTIGTAIQGWWDGAFMFEATSSFNQTATRHGLDWNSQFDATAAFDNFQVKR